MDKKSKIIITIIFCGIILQIGVLLLYFVIPNSTYHYFSFDLIGKVPLCNFQAERAPHIGNFVFILCWRCCGMILFFALGFLLMINHKYCLKIQNTKFIYLLLIIIILLLPMIIDGTRQYVFHIESNNIKRFITGMMFGFGISILTQKLIYELFYTKTKINNMKEMRKS